MGDAVRIIDKFSKLSDVNLGGLTNGQIISVNNSGFINKNIRTIEKITITEENFPNYVTVSSILKETNSIDVFLNGLILDSGSFTVNYQNNRIYFDESFSSLTYLDNIVVNIY